jgi:hypothetical protein
MSAKIAFLDRVLAHYGPETKEARDLLRSSVVRILERMSSGGSTSSSQEEPTSAGAEGLLDKVQKLSPNDGTHRSLQTQALSILTGLGQTRWLMYEQGVTSVTMQLLVGLAFWLTTIFISFGLFAPRNATVITSLSFFALSVSGAILMIPELYSPYAELIRISSAPPSRIPGSSLRNAADALR